MSDCELCGEAHADEHYLDMTPLTEAQKTYGSIFVCETCICEGLKLRRKQLAKDLKLKFVGQINIDA